MNLDFIEPAQCNTLDNKPYTQSLELQDRHLINESFDYYL